MLLPGLSLLFLVIFNTATFAKLLPPSRTENNRQDPGNGNDGIKRQLLIQTNAGLPIISIHPNKLNGTKPIVPNMIITQGPTDFFAQPINALLSFLTSSISAFRPFLSSAANQKQATTVELPPIVIIPQITILLPAVAETTIQPQLMENVKIQELAVGPNKIDDGPIHAILPILGNESSLEADHENSKEFIEEMKRRRVFEDGKPNDEKQTDRIVNHIQSLIQHSFG